MNVRHGLSAVVLLSAGAGLLPTCRAQMAVYAELSGSRLRNLQTTSYLVGPTIGFDDTLFFKRHFGLGFDVRGSFYGDGERLQQISAGPTINRRFHRVIPYAELLAGVARYNDGDLNPVPYGLGGPYQSASSGEAQFVAGVDYVLGGRVDLRVFEYTYEQFYGLGGQYNPKTFSTGLHLRFGHH
jgi:hypothetical protein